MGCFYSKGCIGQVPNSPTESKNKQVKSKEVLNTAISQSSSDDYGEGNDQLNQLSITRDSDVGINRLSRISSQFLPPEGSRTVRVPIGDFNLRYSYLSQRGYYPEALDKPNQDSFCIHTPFGANPDDHFFGVFDGHGEFGAQCSQFVKKKLCETLLRNSGFRMDAVGAFHAAFLSINSQLHADDDLDDTMSGTTAITVLVRGRTLYVANVGDSRAVIAERRGNDIVAVDLSIDQTPFRQDELERVKHCGARVLTLDQIEGLKNPDVQCWGTVEGDDGDPPRLWVQNGMYPGTAFTRSVGDSIAESIGVVATPEIFVLELTPDHPFFVIASDGVFEFLSSQAVVDMCVLDVTENVIFSHDTDPSCSKPACSERKVAKFNDPRDACAAIVAESYRLWLQYETRTDDITIIVVHVNELTDVAGLHASPGDPAKPIQQVLELTGSESPSTITLNSKNNRVRHDLSRARLRAIESSLENGHSWVPPSPSHRKTWEEQAHIERVLHDHFLFRRLTESQCHVLLDCMRKIEVKPEEVVVQQGGEGDCFYVVGSGEFEVLATQEEEGKDSVAKVLHRYTADKQSSFGELALMYNKPLQASVRAVTGGTLWALKREDFRGILMSEFSNLSSLKLLRSVELFSKLRILQLSRVAENLSEVSFHDGQVIIDKDEYLSALYIIQKGHIKLTYNPEGVGANFSSLLSATLNDEEYTESSEECFIEIAEGSHFGEWTLLGENIGSLHAVAIGDVICLVITKENFDAAVGPLSKLTVDEHVLKGSANEIISDENAATITKIQLSDLEWRRSIYATECSEIGLVLLKGSESILSFKRFSKEKIKQLGKEAQVLREKDLMKSLNPSPYVPQVLCTCADRTYVGVLFNCYLSCQLASVLLTPLDEFSARYIAASVLLSLEELHKNSILYRGISPDTLMVNRTGNIQLVDFRYGKKLTSERTFTICGIADTLAPEIVQGKGHGFAADWWALGVLIYFMLQSEMPFGSWRDGELETYARIAKGQLVIPQKFSPEVVDLITKLLEVDENARLGSEGPDSIKIHPWFDGIDWNKVADGTFPVPQELACRVVMFAENHAENIVAMVSSPSQEVDDLNTPEWLEDW